MSGGYQYIVVGAGHNGLVCAAALARAGKRVLVLEANAEVGGMAVTREFAPGFRVSACAHLVNALPADVSRDMALESHGLEWTTRAMKTYALCDGAAPIVFSENGVRGVSDSEAQRFAELSASLSRHAKVITALSTMVPFRFTMASWRERFDGLRLAWKIRSMGRRAMREFLRIAGMNAYDLLTESLDSPPLRGALAFEATLGAEFAARSPGTVLTLLSRQSGIDSSDGRGIAQPKGGMGSVTLAMASSARAAGVEIRCGARVKRLVVEDDRVCGVELEGGEVLRAEAVISNADPRTTFLKLLGPQYLDTDFVRRVDHFRSRGVVAKLHLALDGLPEFNGVHRSELGARMIYCPSLDYLELAFNPSKYRDVPERPALEITIPSVNDPSLAPAGQHVVSINVMFVPYDLGSDPAGARSRVIAAVLGILERHAPGIGARIRASELLTPADLEREFNVAGGHWHHGALTFDQFFFTRPVLGATQYDAPIPGLYLCGAGSHPGGGVMGIAGRNAARRILNGGR